MRGLMVGVLLLALLLGAACSSDATPEIAPTATQTATSTATEPTATGTMRPSPTPILSPRATATPVPEPEPPYLEHFAAGEAIDVSPAVVFVDTETGDAEAWVIPGALSEFAVAPSGSYIAYLSGSPDDPQRHLLRTDDGADREIVADAWPGPLTFGPGDTGFVATTQGGFALTAFDGFGDSLGDLWLGANTGPTTAAWSPDGSLIAIAGYSEDSLILRASIREVGGDMVSLTETGLDEIYSPVALNWSPNSERLALVSSLGLSVFDRAGMKLWHFDSDELRSNLRWSPDSQHLYVPSGYGGSDGSVFTADGVTVLRAKSAGVCFGDPWLADGSGFRVLRSRTDGSDRIYMLDGTVTEAAEQSDLFPNPGRYGARVDGSIGHHFVHLPEYTAGGNWRDTLKFTDGGRFVVTTPGIGHDGCGA